jgi:integrase
MAIRKKRKKRGQGEGTIYQRADGRWTALMTVGWKSGKRVRKQFYGSSAEEVQKKLTAALRDRDRGLPIITDRQTVEQFLRGWLETTAQARLRPRTFVTYRQVIVDHVIPTLGKVLLRELRPQQVQALLASKLQDGLAPRTVCGIRAVLRTALDQAVKWDAIPRNAAALVDPPRLTRYKARVLDVAEAQAFLAAAEQHKLGPLFSVTLAIGLRLGEALGLQWQDIDFGAKTLRVARAVQWIKKEMTYVEPKSERSRRTIPLPAFAYELLEKLRAECREERFAKGKRWKDDTPVFPSSVGTPLDESNVRKAFKAILESAGLPHMRIHDLRHTCATLLVAQGVHPRVVMETLGHSQISLTMDTYSHVLPVLERAAADGMDTLLRKALPA